MSFEIFGLRAELLRAVAAEGYKEPTPIQDQAIPVVLRGEDVLAGAQTGTGKTAAFALPILEMLSKTSKRTYTPRCLVLAPTRELAAQVQASFESLGRSLHLRSTVVFGGVGIQPQIDKLKKGVDILVATPGRLLDHAGRRTLDLSKVEILVLDEADRMLDMGFIHDIKKVLKLLPGKRQNLLFSATYSTEIKRFADGLLNNPKIIEVSASNKAADGVTQAVYPVQKTKKRELLSTLIRNENWTKVLVFTRTKHGANRLTKQLITDGIKAAAIHGNKSQSTRTRALADFKNGSIKALVATDIAARGLDIDMLPHVVNYDLPNVPEDYVHRIGRTGRAGATGIALSLVCSDEQKQLKEIQRLLKHNIPVKTMDGFFQVQETPAKPAEFRNKRPAGQNRSAQYRR
ncbi:putative helicase of superfamily II [Desulforapulum autotrophicum HRM2]|uniref:DEAD-box ATP-dependent RNA helicase RhpA n=1 Tax=Desulforapulum autotrophicum (strain ATCC 43914 / DSM 3382 / VKM B-1955 / HRM2) TaxID=177437 RepID=C0QLQ6_DESAH|nr:DEAD/DEAH box helicase [Desulforapulum autotrophicum]ACN16360.1 putative helicase of superfamily II [Desulforapulum autotrophicum HRM2]